MSKSRHNPTVSFITYNDGGEILRQITCPKDHVAKQRLLPGEQRLIGKANGVTQKVVRQGCCFRIVNKTLAEIEALKAKNPRLRFDEGEIRCVKKSS